ncbi:MAG: DUF5723 family protein [Bacteroides sp.]|nr:DUF5723 family protein [Bacteroides sp.]
MTQHKFSFVFCLLLWIAVASLSAQTTNTTYFMKTYSNRTSLNPALRPEQGYLGMPFILNNLYVDVKTNSLNMDHLTFRQDKELLSFMHKDVSADKFLKGISPNNFANVDFNYSLFSFGFYKGKGFWNVDFTIKAHADANIPYSAFELMKRGFAMNEPSYYNVKNTRIKANTYAELGVGHSRPFLNNTLVVGAKAKVLFGLADFDVHIRDMKVDAGLDEGVVRSYATLNGSAPGLMPVFDEDQIFDTYEWKESFGIPGMGMGVDLGATYALSGLSELTNNDTWSDILNRLTVSVAFTDLGFISWSKGNSSHLYSSLEDEVITGNFNIDFDDSTSLEDDIDKIKDKVEEIIEFKEGEAKSRTTSLRTNMNFGLEYEILKNKLSAGVLSTTYFNSSHTLTEATLGLTYRPASWVETAISYSFVHSKFDTFGFAVNFVPARGVHFFLASDYIIPHVNSEFMPVTSKGINLQMGFSIPLGARIKPKN